MDGRPIEYALAGVAVLLLLTLWCFAMVWLVGGC